MQDNYIHTHKVERQNTDQCHWVYCVTHIHCPKSGLCAIWKEWAIPSPFTGQFNTSPDQRSLGASSKKDYMAATADQCWLLCRVNCSWFNFAVFSAKPNPNPNYIHCPKSGLSSPFTEQFNTSPYLPSLGASSKKKKKKKKESKQTNKTNNNNNKTTHTQNKKTNKKTPKKPKNK